MEHISKETAEHLRNLIEVFGSARFAWGYETGMSDNVTPSSKEAVKDALFAEDNINKYLDRLKESEMGLDETKMDDITQEERASINAEIAAEDKKYAEHARKVKEIEGLKYPIGEIGMWLGDSINGIGEMDVTPYVSHCMNVAHAMISFNRLCNEEMDRVK